MIDYGQNGSGAPSFNGGGNYPPTDSALTRWINSMGGKWPSIIHMSTKQGNGSGGTTPWSSMQPMLDAAIAHGMMPLIEMGWWDFTNHAADFSFRPAAQASGTWDAYWTDHFTNIRNWGKPVAERYAWEPNLSGQFPWQFGPTGTLSVTFGGNTWTNTLADFLAGWQRVIGIRNSVYANVPKPWNHIAVWCPNNFLTSETITPAQMYPGDNYVDWLAFDSYVGKGSPQAGKSITQFWNTVGGGLKATYTELCNLHPSKPILVGETNFGGKWQSENKAVTSVTSDGAGHWNIVLSAAPTHAPAATQGFELYSFTPSSVNGQYTVNSWNSTTNTVQVNNSNAVPTITTMGQGIMVDRIARKAMIAQSRLDLPTMPRIKAILDFWTQYTDTSTSWAMDYDGQAGQFNNIDLAEFRSWFNEGRFLAGGQMATDVSGKFWIPFQDQAVTTPNERFLEVLKSIGGLKGGWPQWDPSGSTTLADVLGARPMTVTGSIGLGSASSSVPAEPSKTAGRSSGTAGNFASVASSADWSPNATTGEMTIVSAFQLPSAPTVTGQLFSKATFTGGNNYEYQTPMGATTWGFTMNQNNGGTFASLSVSYPASGFFGVWHFWVIRIRLGDTLPIVGRLDGVAQPASTGKTGAYTAGAAPLQVYQINNTGVTPANQPLMNLASAVILGVYDNFITDESADDLYSAWLAGPVISSLVAA